MSEIKPVFHVALFGDSFSKSCIVYDFTNCDQILLELCHARTSLLRSFMRNRDPYRENVENILAISLPIVTMQHIRESPSASHAMRISVWNGCYHIKRRLNKKYVCRGPGVLTHWAQNI